MKKNPPAVSGSAVGSACSDSVFPQSFRKFRSLLLLAALVCGAAVCPAYEVVWDASTPGVGHTNAVSPNFSGTQNQSQMALLLAEAKTYLADPNHIGITLVLSFPPGTYNFDLTVGTTPAISLHKFNKTNDTSLILRGAGSDATHFVFQNYAREGMQVRDCQRVTVENMHLTRNDPTYGGVYTSLCTLTAMGTTSGTGTSWIKFTVDENWPDAHALSIEPNANNHVKMLIPFRDGNGHGHPLDPEGDMTQGGLAAATISAKDGNGEHTATLQLALGTMKIYQTTPLGWPIGQRFALACKVGAPTVRYHNTKDCVARNLRFTRNSSNPFLISMSLNANNPEEPSDNCLVERLRMERHEPIVSGTTARVPFFCGPGGGLMTTASTQGHTIRDCVVVGSSDDGIGAYSFNNVSGTTMPSGWVIENNFVRDSGRAFIIEANNGGVMRFNQVVRSDGGPICMGNFRDNTDANGNKVGSDAGLLNWVFSDNIFEESRGNPCINLIGTAKFVGRHDNIVIARNLFVKAPRNHNLIILDQFDTVEISENEIVSFNTEDTFAYSSVPGYDGLVYLRDGFLVTGTNNFMEEPLQTGRNAFDAPASLFSGTISATWTEEPVTEKEFTSTPTHDGYIVESSESSNMGGAMFNNVTTGTGLRVGDTSTDKQQKSILSFSTGAAIADDARIVWAKVRIKRATLIGESPFLRFGSCWADIIDGSFHTSPALQTGDFEAAAGVPRAVFLKSAPTNGDWLEGYINPRALESISKTGTTQFRIAFDRDDDDNLQNDYLGLYPGEYSNTSFIPQLQVRYRQP